MSHTDLETNLPEPRPFNCRPEIFWLGLTTDLSWDEAAAIFERKHGYPPNRELSFKDDTIWHVGPIEEENL